MRQKLIILTILLVPMISLAEFEETSTGISIQFVNKEGLWYEVNSETPFSGVVRRTTLSGQKTESNYLNGKVHGYMRRWYENGIMAREAFYVDGESNGLETTWYPNGQIHAVTDYVNGKAQGYQEVWHENGTKYSQGNYVNGQPHGIHTDWYENGQKQSEYTYVYGEKHGVVTQWDQNGNKTQSCYEKDKKLHDGPC